MAYVRKYKKRSTMRKRRSPYRKRRFNITRRKAASKSGFLRTVRCSNLETTWNSHAIYFGDDTLQFVQTTALFRLSDLPNYTELTNLFDNYRITRIMYRWVLYRQPSSDLVTIGGRGVLPNLMWVHDFNDSTAIGRAQMMTHAGMREVYLSDAKPATRWYSLKPAVLSQVYETGLGAPAYSPKWGQWMDTNDINTPHYGIKLNINNFFSNMAIRLEAKYVLEFKGVS